MISFVCLTAEVGFVMDAVASGGKFTKLFLVGAYATEK